MQLLSVVGVGAKIDRCPERRQNDMHIHSFALIRIMGAFITKYLNKRYIVLYIHWIDTDNLKLGESADVDDVSG